MSDKYQIIDEVARRRGFFWPAFEIYGGMSGFIDLGPLGTLMRRKIEELWLQIFVKRHGFVEISSPVLTPEKIFRASGHLDHFKDPMVECSRCRRRYRADHLLAETVGMATESMSLRDIDDAVVKNAVKCAECGGKLSESQFFTTMFQTVIGPYSESVGFGRPEAAQGMFIDFKRVYEVCREKLPMAIAQIGTVLRNEISPRQGPIRLREFRIMEFELFFDPEESQCEYLSKVEGLVIPIVPIENRLKGKEEAISLSVGEAVRKKVIANEWLAYVMALSWELLSKLGIAGDLQRFHEKLPNERAHYSKQTFDHEVKLDRWGWVEMAGHAYRSDYDLRSHTQFSGQDLSVFRTSTSTIDHVRKTVVPIIPALRQTFKDELKENLELIRKANPDEVEKALNEKGYLIVGGVRIGPEHIRVELKQVKESGRRVIPHVVEPSFGVERLVYATLEHSYSTHGERIVMKIPPSVSPYQTIVLPLITKNGLPELAQSIYWRLLEDGWDVDYDEKGSIGRRYARADEIGTPLAITVDYQSLKDDTVTLRERDSWKQIRAPIRDVPTLLVRYVKDRMPFVSLGDPIVG